MALRPSGVAALSRPSMLAAMFMKIEPVAGWPLGMSGNSLVNTGLSTLARAFTTPPRSPIFITPSHSDSTPVSPSEISKAVLAELNVEINHRGKHLGVTHEDKPHRRYGERYEEKRYPDVVQYHTICKNKTFIRYGKMLRAFMFIFASKKERGRRTACKRRFIRKPFGWQQCVAGRRRRPTLLSRMWSEAELAVCMRK